jgi:signal transduction histidine kinase
MSSPISLMPHAVCWRDDPQLIWVMVVTNAITFLSYLSICCTLLFLARRTRRVMARDWAWFVVGFALFIVACGATHLMEVVTTWVPWFWIDAAANELTAGLSAYVAVQLIRRIGTISFSINDYAARLASTEREKLQMMDSLMAAQKLEDWSRTSTVIAHEIANPLEAIQNLLYLIRSSADVSAEVVQLAQTAADEADRVLTISRSTLSFFRQGTEPESTDLRAAADSVCVLLESIMHNKDIALKIAAVGDTHVEALPGEARQALLNLVRNAYEATTRPGADVHITLTGKPEAVEIVVADQGSGIGPEMLEKLFQFGVTTKGAQGNGMGLWAVRHILQKHGGDIRAESVVGHGTTFAMVWPRRFGGGALVETKLGEENARSRRRQGSPRVTWGAFTGRRRAA